MSWDELYTGVPAIEFFYDDDRNHRLTIQVDYRWAEFYLVPEDCNDYNTGYTRYNLKSFGPVFRNQGDTEVNMADIHYIVDQLKAQIPGIKIKGHHSLFFTEECRSFIKLKYGLTIAQY